MIRWFASLLLLPSLAWAELPPGPFARIVVLRPRDGMQSRFEEGYKRHLEWHRQNNDSWTWLGWSFVLGKRAGWFMDGTFGHAPENFDAAVAPAADAADNAANVFPYAELVTHGVFQYLPALSRGGPQAPTSPFLELTTIELQPGHQSVFEALLNRLAQNRGDSQLLWYKLVAGGSSPTYLLMKPRLSLSQVARATAFLENPDLVEADRKAIASSVGHVEIEVLRYRADLSYIPPRPP